MDGLTSPLETVAVLRGIIHHFATDEMPRSAYVANHGGRLISRLVHDPDLSEIRSYAMGYSQEQDSLSEPSCQMAEA